MPSSASSSSSSDLRCGDHAARAYVHKVERMQRVFAWLAARD